MTHKYAKKWTQGSIGSKDRMETDQQTDRWTDRTSCNTSSANTVGLVLFCKCFHLVQSVYCINIAGKIKFLQSTIRKHSRWALCTFYCTVVITVCDTVWIIPHLHLSENARRDLCRFAAQRPWSVQKQFRAHHVQQGMSNRGCQIITLSITTSDLLIIVANFLTYDFLTSTAVHWMSTKFGVDSSSHFPFRARTQTYTHSHRCQWSSNPQLDY